MSLLNPINDIEYGILLFLIILGVATIIFGGIGIYKIWKDNDDIQTELKDTYNDSKSIVKTFSDLVNFVTTSVSDFISGVADCINNDLYEDLDKVKTDLSLVGVVLIIGPHDKSPNYLTNLQEEAKKIQRLMGAQRILYMSKNDIKDRKVTLYSYLNVPPSVFSELWPAFKNHEFVSYTTLSNTSYIVTHKDFFALT